MTTQTDLRLLDVALAKADGCEHAEHLYCSCEDHRHSQPHSSSRALSYFKDSLDAGTPLYERLLDAREMCLEILVGSYAAVYKRGSSTALAFVQEDDAPTDAERAARATAKALGLEVPP